MSMWSTDDSVVMDLSSFVDVMGGLDPTTANELAVFRDGPVSIDFNRLRESGVDSSVDASALASQFGGAQVTDPADLVAALASIDQLEEAGTGTVNGFAVEVYTADVSMGDYTEAIGQEGLGDLTALEGLGLDAGFDDSMLEAIENLEVDMTLMVDGEGLVRQVTTTIDMGDIFASIAAEEGGFGLGGDVEMVVETWQTFDNYGDDFDVTPPEAVDVTNEILGLIDS